MITLKLRGLGVPPGGYDFPIPEPAVDLTIKRAMDITIKRAREKGFTGKVEAVQTQIGEFLADPRKPERRVRDGDTITFTVLPPREMQWEVVELDI